MDSMNNIFSLIMLGCGIYCLYVWLRIHRTGEIPANSIILPKDRTMDTCLDPEQFRDYIQPRLLVFSILIILFGVFGLVDAQLNLVVSLADGLSPLLRLLVIELVNFLLPFAVVIWFGVCLYRIQKQFW